MALSGENIKAQKARLRDSPNVVVSTSLSSYFGHSDVSLSVLNLLIFFV